MKNFRQNKYSGRWYLIVSIVCLLLSVSGQTQSTKGAVDKKPTDEDFDVADGLMMPWRDSSCWTTPVREAACDELKPGNEASAVRKTEGNRRLTLFNEDGSEWLTFSLEIKDHDYFKNLKSSLFSPFGIGPGGGDANSIVHPNIVVLRVVGESPSWYKVEVHEGTRDVKYVSKNDKLWTFSTWEFWLNRSRDLLPDLTTNPLRETPGGKEIEYERGPRFRHFKFQKRDGDWVQVTAYLQRSDPITGWIRWRDGRKIIVGWFFNNPDGTTTN